MKSLRRRTDAQYIRAGTQSNRLTRASRRKNTFLSAVCGMLAAVFLFVTIISSVGVSTITAHADDSQDTLDAAAKAYGAEGTPEGFLNSLDKYQKEPDAIDRNSFGYLLDRLITTGYINYTPDASAGDGGSVPANGLSCDANAPGAGTLIHHNCDVPNITTEFLQDAASLLLLDGPQYAETDVATVDNQWFGLPGNIPGNSVPVNASERSVKYTGLELYGYNMKYTNYAGEWDHVKVMTAARSLSNFGFMDNLKLSVKTVINGVTNGMQASVTNIASSLSEGDIFGAIGGAFSGFWGGGAAASVNTVLDTSDLNVMNSNAWYRVGFGSTLYNARELTQEELAAQAKVEFLNMVTNSRPDTADIPEDLIAIQALPEDPKEAIASCSYKDAAGNQSTYGDTSRAPGPLEADCSTMADNAYAQRQEAEDPPDGDSASYTWKEEGTQALETLESWKSAHSNHFETASKYEMECSLDTSEANRKDSLAALKACWPGAWTIAADKARAEVQTSVNTEWMMTQVDPETLSKWFAGDPSRNFNAPWQRFVCVDANGQDIRVDGKLVKAYNAAGELNPQCGSIRTPIQNGLFGNGYITDKNEPGYSASTTVPPEDTRNSLVDANLFTIIFPIDSIVNETSNFGLSIAVLTTRISNTVLNLSFSPILETLGLTDKIIEIIIGLRDSLFFPLAVLVIAFSGLTILFKVGKERNYGQQAVSILIMALTFVSGVLLMYRPELVMKAVDEVPAQIEQAIVGTIFSVGSNADDELCTATGTASAPTEKGLKGESLSYSPRTATRSLMCENWRVFAFTPYVYGQWGTSFDQLYAENTSKPDKMKNTNTSLVGDAGVNMGSGRVVNNWGLYQLDVLSSGTSTDRDFTKSPGFVDSDFYRIVDMQAGPNNGAGTDNRYLQDWSGNGGFGRAMVGLISAVVGIIGLVTVVAFAITKIEITFVTTFMLLFMPMMFLMGLHPTIGRGKLKSYFGTILSLMIQRVVLVTLLAIMFKIVIGVGTASTGYMLVGFTTAAVCVIFLFYKKEIMGMISNTVGASFGGSFGGDAVSNPRAAIAQHVPTAVKNVGEQVRRGAIGYAGGAVGGYLSGRGVLAGAKESKDFELQSLRNSQRRKGYGVLQSAYNAGKGGKDDALQKAADNFDRKEMAQDLMFDTDKGVDSRIINNLDEAMKEVANERGYEVGDWGSKAPSPGGLLTGHTAQTARELARLVEVERKINEISLKDTTTKDEQEENQRILESDDINLILEDQERLRSERRREVIDTDDLNDDSLSDENDDSENIEDKKLQKLLNERAKLRDNIMKRENAAYSRGTTKEQMKQELKDMVDKANEALDEADRR